MKDQLKAAPEIDTHGVDSDHSITDDMVSDADAIQRLAELQVVMVQKIHQHRRRSTPGKRSKGHI